MNRIAFQIFPSSVFLPTLPDLPLFKKPVIRTNYILLMKHEGYDTPGLARMCLHCNLQREVSCESINYWKSLFHNFECGPSLSLLQYELSRCRHCFFEFRDLALERIRGRPKKDQVEQRKKPIFPNQLPSFPLWNPNDLSHINDCEWHLFQSLVKKEK